MAERACASLGRVTEGTVDVFARSSNGGLIVPGSASAVIHRDLIVALAARYKAARRLL
jgi:hypothetical protein